MLKSVPNWVKLLVKIVVSVACLWYVGRKIDWPQAWQLLGQSNKWWLVPAVVLFVASKVISSIRLNYYFKNIDIQLPEKTNLQLYWMGMYYNLFLPGGIGGDAYKVILLNREYKAVPGKKITAAVVLDRLSGLVGMAILIAVLYFIVFSGGNYAWWLVAAIIPGLALYYWLVKKLFPSFITSYWPTLGLGLAVQLLQVLQVACLIQSMGLHIHFFEYQLLFLTSSLAVVLPLTVGGLGLREVVFLEGSNMLGLDAQGAVFISLLFYLITVVVSAVGIVWVYRNPLAKRDLKIGGFES